MTTQIMNSQFYSSVLHSQQELPMIRGGSVNIAANAHKSRNQSTRSLYAQLLARIQEKNRLKAEENKAKTNISENVAAAQPGHVVQQIKSSVSPLYSYTTPRNVGSLSTEASPVTIHPPHPSSRLQFPSSNNRPVRIQSSAQYFRLLAKKKGIKIGDAHQHTPSTSAVRPTTEIPSSLSIIPPPNEIKVENNVISDHPIPSTPKLPPPPVAITGAVAPNTVSAKAVIAIIIAVTSFFIISSHCFF